MSLALAYWIVMFIALIVFLYFNWPPGRPLIPGLIIWILLIILGWKVFGPPLHS